jgi:RHS repeat-associated protein
MPTDKLFTGQRLDSGTGLYYNGARYYDPSLGRFISPDMVVPTFENPQSFNRYSYVKNNPLKYIDPTGLDEVIVGGKGQTEAELWEVVENLWIECFRFGSGRWTASEMVSVYADPDNLDPVNRAEVLRDKLNNGVTVTTPDGTNTNYQYKDIKLTGYSLGAEIIAVYLSKMDTPEFGAKAGVTSEIRSATMLDRSTWVINLTLTNLPQRLESAGHDIKIVDVYSKAGIVHNENTWGWNGVSSAYDSRNWAEKALVVFPIIDFSYRAANTLTGNNAHGELWESELARRRW